VRAKAEHSIFWWLCNVINKVASKMANEVANNPVPADSLLDARWPRALACVMAAVAIWLAFAAGFVRGLWLADDHVSTPKPIAFDVQLVRLPPPERPPRPQQQTTARATQAPQPPAAPVEHTKPARAVRHSAAPATPPTPAPPHSAPQQVAPATAAPAVAHPTQPTLPTPPAAPAVQATPPTPVAARGNGPSQAEAPATSPTQRSSADAGNGPAHAILQPLPSLLDDLREDAFQAVATAPLYGSPRRLG
jgi:periplasmic protein TonB